MNKLKVSLIAIVSSVLMIASSSAIEVRVGAAAQFALLEATGSETLKDSNKVTTHTEQANAVIPSFFAEVAMDNGLGIGLDYIVGSADLAGSNQQSIGNADSNRAEDTGTNTANASVGSIHTLYLTKMFNSGLFVKLGMASADVKTKETLASGTTYGNKSVDGLHYGIGFERANDAGLFMRTALEHTDFDTVSLTGDESGEDTASFNKIKADVDVTAVKFSIGKRF